MQTTESGVLRARAAELRRVARAIDATPALDLGRHALDDTWRGERATQCVETLRGHRDRLLASAVDLRAQARRFDDRADHLDMALLRAQGPR